MSLKLCKGGSQITFSPNVTCCIESCESTREINPKLPFYTFPSDPLMCKQWLKEIPLKASETEDLEKLHTTHVVCSKHFQLYKGGMKLCVGLENNKCVENSMGKVSSSTQTYDNNWIETLKLEYGIEIENGTDIQCRVCASTSVQAINIYKKSNEKLNLKRLINSLLPIKVNLTDSKPLNICVHCVFKLKQYVDLCDLSAKIDSSNEFTKKKNINTSTSEFKKYINKKNPTTDSENEDNNRDNNNTTKIKNHNERTDTNECLDGSKLSKNNSNPNDYIKKESRKHKIKILVSSKNNNITNSELTLDIHEETSCTSNTNKVIDVEFEAEYIICHGIEWVHKINVEEDQLMYSQETIDHILKVIRSTMKKQCEKNNSTVVPLPISPLDLDRVMVSCSQQELRTESVIINGKQQVYDEICRKAAEMLKKKEPLLKSWNCKKCGLKLDNKQSFTKHIKFRHPRPCRFCGENIAPREKLILHEKEHCKPSIDGFVCDLCGRQFKTNKSLNDHYKQHQNYERFCCTTCNLQFNNGFGLRKHIRQQHKELLVEKKPEDIKRKRQKCSICELWLSSRLALRVHMKTHLPIEERMKTCPDCKKIFINARRFKMHIETHGPCPIKCPECPRSFPSQEHLDNHLHYHKITEPVYCDICQRNFKTRTTLKNHNVRVHQGVQYVQKTFTCIFCKIVFSNKDELKMHSNTHSFEEKAQAFAGDQYGKVQCNECNKYFLFKSRLTIHKLYHHISPCAQCGKHTTDDLTNHCCKPRGSRALQYCCQYCTKRFSSKQRLNLHERTHGLDYRFQCTVCSKWFTKMSALKTHSHSHSSLRQYVCFLCGKMCKLVSTLKRHMKVCHNTNKNIDNLNPDHIHNVDILPITGNESVTTHPALPLTIPVSMPITDEQDCLICDVSHHIDMSHIDGPDHQLQSVDIVDLQNLYVE